MAAQLSCSDLQILGACVGSTGASCSARALALQQYVFLGHVLAVSTESLIAQIMMDLFFFFFFFQHGEVAYWYRARRSSYGSNEHDAV